MRQEVLFMGIVLVIVGVILISTFLASPAKGKFAVVGFIGPIPFGAGNDSGLVKMAMMLAGIALVAFMMVGFLLPRLGRFP